MFEHIPIGPKAPSVVNAVIEIPRGSHNKYEYDEELRAIKLDRVLFSPFHYPTEYGFIPETRSQDGDHLDVLVVATDPLFPGCVLSVRPIGFLNMKDSGEMDEKILAVPADDPRFTQVKTMEDLPEHFPKEVAHFFESYKKLEGKTVEILGWGSREDAVRILSEAMARFTSEAK